MIFTVYMCSRLFTNPICGLLKLALLTVSLGVYMISQYFSSLITYGMDKLGTEHAFLCALQKSEGIFSCDCTTATCPVK